MKKGYVDLEKYGFKITQRTRKDWAGSKKIWVRKNVAVALLKAKSFLPEEYNFIIFDGKRSIEDQRRIIQICEKDFKRRDPKNWKQMLIDFTGGYVVLKQKKFSPMSHLGGGAIDLTLSKGRKELDLGGDTFDEREALDYYEKKKKLTKKEKTIRDNRRILKKAMTKAGFKGYPKEWIHWGFKG